jgi:hypothetical protein
MLDLLSGEKLAELKNGTAYVRKRSGMFLLQETAILHENAGRNAEQRRKSKAVPSMVVRNRRTQGGFRLDFGCSALLWFDWN